MADEREEAKGDQAKDQDSSAEAKADKPAGEAYAAPPPPKARQELPPADALVQGLGLLWQAARGAAEGLNKRVEKAGVERTIGQAGQAFENAATTALRGLEQVVRSVGRAAGAAAGTRVAGEEPARADRKADGDAKAEEAPRAGAEAPPPDRSGDGGSSPG